MNRLFSSFTSFLIAACLVAGCSKTSTPNNGTTGSGSGPTPTDTTRNPTSPVTIQITNSYAIAAYMVPIRSRYVFDGPPAAGIAAEFNGDGMDTRITPHLSIANAVVTQDGLQITLKHPVAVGTVDPQADYFDAVKVSDTTRVKRYYLTDANYLLVASTQLADTAIAKSVKLVQANPRNNL